MKRRRRRDQSKDKVKEDAEFREEKSCGPLQGGLSKAPKHFQIKKQKPGSR